MFWLRLYELVELQHGHLQAHKEAYKDSNLWLYCPGFLNAVNWYYDYRVWR